MNFRPQRKHKIIALLILGILLIGVSISMCGRTDVLSKTDEVAGWFAAHTSEGELLYEPLTALAINEHALIENNDEISIELVDVLRSGSIVKAGFLITLKNVDTAVVDGSFPTLPGWGFENCFFPDTGVALARSSIAYFYKPDYPTLKQNQFLMIITLFGVENKVNPFTVEMENIVCYDRKQGQKLLIIGRWTSALNLEVDYASGKILFPDMEFWVGDTSFTLQKIEISAFGCVATCQINEEMLQSWCDQLMERSESFYAVAHKMTIYDEEGNSIPFGLVGCTWSEDDTKWTGTYKLVAEFKSPKLNRPVKRIDLFGLSVHVALEK